MTWTTDSFDVVSSYNETGTVWEYHITALDHTASPTLSHILVALAGCVLDDIISYSVSYWGWDDVNPATGEPTTTYSEIHFETGKDPTTALSGAKWADFTGVSYNDSDDVSFYEGIFTLTLGTGRVAELTQLALKAGSKKNGFVEYATVYKASCCEISSATVPETPTWLFLALGAALLPFSARLRRGLPSLPA